MPPRTAPVIVTGGAGLIGSAVVALLSARGQPVAVVDVLHHDLRYRHLRHPNLAGYWHRDEFLPALHRGDIAPPAAIVHLGACSATTESDADFLMRNNFGYTRELAHWCLDHGVRFVYASSAATYGAGEHGYADDLRQLPGLQPLNPYAVSKHAFDLWALAHGAFQQPGAVAGLKFFNVYGPNEHHKGSMRSMVLKAFEQIQRSGSVQLFRSHHPAFADGDQERDFIYVKDAAAVTAWFLDHPAAAGLFNVGTGVSRTWNHLARAVFTALNLPAQIDYIDMPNDLRAGYQYSTRADLVRLRNAGCDLRFRSLEEGVQDYVQQHLLPEAGAAR